MVAADTQAPPALPDYVTDSDAVLKDTNVNWRYGRAPDYSKTRKVFAESKLGFHYNLPMLCQVARHRAAFGLKWHVVTAPASKT